MRGLRSISFALLAAGCGSTPSSRTVSRYVEQTPAPVIVRPVYADPTFSAAQRESITEAIAVWNTELAGHLVLVMQPYEHDIEMHPGNGIVIFNTLETTPFIPRPASGRFLGWSDDIPGHVMWVMTQRVSPENLQPLVMHEMGHLLGAHHFENGGLMSALDPLRPFPCIDKESVEQVAIQYNLPSYSYCGRDPLPR